MKTDMKCVLVALGLAMSTAQIPFAQSPSLDSLALREIFNAALSEGESHDRLRELTKDIGHRLSGSESATMAMEWGLEWMIHNGADTAFIMPVKVPSWSRGTSAWAQVHFSDGRPSLPLHITALGGSEPTPAGQPIRAKLLVVKNLNDLDSIPDELKKGRIVLFNRPMDPLSINTGSAYGGAYDQRGRGAIAAARFGGVGALVRSLTHSLDTLPHTGSMHYDDEVARIPAAAISTVDASLLAELWSTHPDLEVEFFLYCETHPDVIQGNVIGVVQGNERPEEVIALGGHLDSWDIGEGAHDDGAGVVHTLEALRILQAMGYKPRRTLHFVLFINEENGNRGGIRYAEVMDSLAQTQSAFPLAAIESDAGGFVPRGFRLDAPDASVDLIRASAPLWEPYEIHQFRRGGAGVDISPLKEISPRPTLVGLSPDGQRYFDFHHSAQDVFENVHKRELELGAATVAGMMRLLDLYLPPIH